jgi:lipoprotein NlpD
MKDSVRLWIPCIALLLAACSPTRAPVVDYSRDSGDIKTAGEKVTRGTHVVREGETLYSIAWRYGWDFRELARANDIGSPYTIYPGQKIDLGASPGSADPATRPETSGRASASRERRPATSSGGNQDGDNASEARREESSPVASSGPVTWQWPAEGELVGRFDGEAMSGRGITIAGREGAPVRAAGAGTVVYRGNGLTGYGNLLIVKHNRQWLSAYAHNREMLVKEGASVDAGQRIATMGASGTYRTQLHFEIRREGQPVDPVPLLPER